MHEIPADVTRETEALAHRVLEALGDPITQSAPRTAGSGTAPAAGARKSAWDLKMELKVSHTQLHLALGWLAGRGRVVLSEGPLTLMVERSRPAPSEAPAQNPPAEAAPAA